MNPLLAALQDLRNILGICPCCGEFFRLSDVQISYRARPRRTWLDRLETEESKIQRAADRFQDGERAMRDEAHRRAREQLPQLLAQCEPIFSCRGLHPQDAKSLFDPIDFVVFDGMTLSNTVNRLVFLDGPPENRGRERLQHSIERVLKKGNCNWQTIRLSKDGRIANADKSSETQRRPDPEVDR